MKKIVYIYVKITDEMKKLLNSLPVRADYKNVSLRKNLLLRFNTPIEYSEKLSAIIQEVLREKKILKFYILLVVWSRAVLSVN